MDLIAFLIDFILHVDKHLAAFVQAYGAWVYALLFLIVFVETGVVVMPFLPGDSLLFVVGTLCGVGLMSLPLAMGLLILAAVLGDQTNYLIGRHVGPRVWAWEHSRFFNKRAFEQAHAFYERWGGITIILARFMPFIRTFAPFVAGVAEMNRAIDQERQTIQQLYPDSPRYGLELDPVDYRRQLARVQRLPKGR